MDMGRRVKMRNWVYNCYVCIISDEEAAYVLGWSYKVAGMAGGLAGWDGLQCQPQPLYSLQWVVGRVLLVDQSFSNWHHLLRTVYPIVSNI